jgi:hypothetical protein
LASRSESTDSTRQAPHSCLQERTSLPSSTPPTLPLERLGPSRLESSSTESVHLPSPNELAHSAPKHRMHLPPGSPGPPKGTAALDRLEAVHQHPLRKGRAVDAKLAVSPSILPGLANDFGASTAVMPSIGSSVPSTMIVSLECCHSRSLHTSETASPTAPNDTRLRFSKGSATFAQYPIGWIHQRCRRLPAFCVGSSATAVAISFDPSSSKAQPGRPRS